MQAELEADDNPEVSAAAAQSPQEIWIFGSAGAHEAAFRCHHIRSHEIVTGQPMPTTQPADAAGQGEARNASGRDQAAGSCAAKRCGCRVDVAPLRAAQARPP